MEVFAVLKGAYGCTWHMPTTSLTSGVCLGSFFAALQQSHFQASFTSVTIVVLRQEKVAHMKACAYSYSLLLPIASQSAALCQPVVVMLPH